MPELPEVETVVSGLKKRICGKIINRIEVLEEMVLGYPPEVEVFCNGLRESRIEDLDRRGKYIIIELCRNRKLIVHLRMTGKLLIRKNDAPPEKYTRVIFRFKYKEALFFNNMRKFGRLYLINDDEEDKAGSFSRLGPEPFDEDFTPEYLKQILNGRKASIKSVLLDQSNVAGLGNIYSDEALYRAGIKPIKPAGKLDNGEIKSLYGAIIDVLEAGIKYSGTSFSDYVNALGESGDFQEKLNVYGREGEECPFCGSRIEKCKVSGRSSHYCSRCQS